MNRKQLYDLLLDRNFTSFNAKLIADEMFREQPDETVFALKTIIVKLSSDLIFHITK